MDEHSRVLDLMGKRELVALLNLSSWCLVMVERLFLAVPWGCLRFVIVVFPDHTHLLFLISKGRWLETHQRQYVDTKSYPLLQFGSTQEDKTFSHIAEKVLAVA